MFTFCLKRQSLLLLDSLLQKTWRRKVFFFPEIYSKNVFLAEFVIFLRAQRVGPFFQPIHTFLCYSGFFKSGADSEFHYPSAKVIEQTISSDCCFPSQDWHNLDHSRNMFVADLCLNMFHHRYFHLVN